MSGRLRQLEPPKEEPFSQIPRWLLRAVSPGAYMLYGYYAGRDYDRDGMVYVTVEQVAKELDWCIRTVKTHRTELKRAGAIDCKRGSPATKLHFSREVQHPALVEVQNSAHREDWSRRPVLSTNTKDFSTESEEVDIPVPSQNEVLEDNRTSAESCTSPDAQKVSTGATRQDEPELDLEALKQTGERLMAPIQAEREEAEQRAERRRELVAALRS